MTTSYQEQNTAQKPEFPAPERPQTIPPLAWRGYEREWLDSQVSDSLIAANEILAIEGDAVYERLLAEHNSDRRNDGRLTDQEMNRYQQLADGGWWFGTVSVRTGELTGYGCFKPDNPRENPENGKPIKYESPLGAKPQLLAFNIPPEIWQKISDRYLVPIFPYINFYQWLHDHPKIPMFLTEGSKKIGCLLSLGYAAVGVAGVTHCYSKDENGKRVLHPDLAYLANGTRSIYFAFDFDSDSKTRHCVHNIIRKTAGLLKTHNPTCRVFKVTWNGAKGVDDWLKLNSPEAFATQVKRAKKVMPIDPQLSETDQEGNNQKKNSTQQAYEIFNRQYDLKFNELLMSVELDGKSADPSEIWIDLRLIHGVYISQEECQALLLKCAKQNSYHPVRDYLNQVAERVPPINITNLAQRYFGTINPIHNEMMYRHLIGSVARIFEPGCKKDEAVILQGSQGILKSTFWQILYGEDFFSDSLTGTERDDLLVMHQYWCLELAEFETITGKKQAGELKSFLSRAVDTFREPYGRISKKRPRSSVIVGSVNPQSFLVDETGNRRFWVIPVAVPRIDVNLLQQEKDAIWAAAVQAYRSGEQWHLDGEFAQQLSSLNERYRLEDSWLTPIANYLERRTETTIHEVLLNALEFEVRTIQKRDEMRVSNLLNQLGWQRNGRVWSGSRYLTQWVKVEQPRQVVHEVVHEVVHPQPQSGQSFNNFEQLEQPNLETFLEDSPLPTPPPIPNPHQGDLGGRSRQADGGTQIPVPKFEKKVVKDVQTAQPQSEQVIQLEQPNEQPSEQPAVQSVVQTIEWEWTDLIAAQDAEFERLGWTIEQRKAFVQHTYGQKARQLLSDRQLVDLLEQLRRYGERTVTSDQ